MHVTQGDIYCRTRPENYFLKQNAYTKKHFSLQCLIPVSAPRDNLYANLILNEYKFIIKTSWILAKKEILLQVVEDKFYFLIICQAYNDIRYDLLWTVDAELSDPNIQFSIIMSRGGASQGSGGDRPKPPSSNRFRVGQDFRLVGLNLVG